MQSERYFPYPPARKHAHGLMSKIIVKGLIIVFIYGVALFSLYWFMWFPAYTEDRYFTHSPTLFFAVVWVIGSGPAIGYAIWGLIHSSRVSNNMNEEITELGEHLYKTEDMIQEQLGSATRENRQSSSSAKSNSMVLGGEGQILWEVYDTLLE